MQFHEPTKPREAPLHLLHLPPTRERDREIRERRREEERDTTIDARKLGLLALARIDAPLSRDPARARFRALDPATWTR